MQLSFFVLYAVSAFVFIKAAEEVLLRKLTGISIKHQIITIIHLLKTILILTDVRSSV